MLYGKTAILRLSQILRMTTFYDNINDYFEKDEDVKNNIKEPSIHILHSRIIKDYNDKIRGDPCEYFEDKVMTRFNESVAMDADEDTDVYENICNQIITIYYNSVADLDNYYKGIYKKKKFDLCN
jgi:hypothetical protein